MAANRIPEKLYFKIGEVARIAGVKPYVLRYWETEFKVLDPVKSRSGQRMYRRRDVDLVLKIKELLYNQRFTIEGARQKIIDFASRDLAPSEKSVEKKATSDTKTPKAPEEMREILLEMRQEVVELLELTESSTSSSEVPSKKAAR